MRLLIGVVGHRTEHWIGYFESLAAQPDVELAVVAADVTELTVAGLDRLARQHSNFTYWIVGHWLGEQRTGHMASVVFKPGWSRRLVGWGRPDIVHAIGEPSYLSVRQLFRWRARHWPTSPITCYAAQNIVIDFPPPFPRLERATYRQVTQLWPVSQDALDVVTAKGFTGSARIFPLGVDASRFRPGPASAHSPFRVGFIGRLEAFKGVEELLVATRALPVQVVFIGEGSLAGVVDAAAESQSIRRLGWVDHDRLPSLISELDVVVLPSIETVQRNLPGVAVPLREQFGRVLVEAMACGKPVIGSDLGEIPKVIGDAGWVCPPGDSVALSEAIMTCRDDPAEAQRRGSLGRARVERDFAWQAIASRAVAAWQALDGRTLDLTDTKVRP